MMGTQRRERVEALARVLDGDLDAGEVGREVRNLATLAGHVRDEVDPVVMTAEARDAVRDRVLAELLAPAPEPVPTRTRVARSTRTAVATGLASVLVGATGVTVAAQEALPDDALYGIKRATESIRLAMAGDLVETGRVELDLARERLEEVTAGADRLRTETLVSTLADMDARALSGAEALARTAERSDAPEHLATVLAFTERQAAGLVDVFDDLPVVVRPHAEDSIATLRRIRVELLAPVLDACDCADVVAAAATDCLVCGLSDLGSRLVSSPLPLPTTTTPEPSDDERAGEGPDDAAPAEIVTDDDEAPATVADPGSSTSPGGSGDARTDVPELPGPLDAVGRTVDGVVGGVTDTVGRVVEDTTGTVGKVLDDTGRAVDGLLRGDPNAVPGLVGDTLDSVGGLVDDTLGTVGDLLRPRPRD
ncbi:hypothetical protein FTX61_03230 [Nitriliruptoraceae bacterium ZYF776]|nr:hypothetical protein [Profundirhabdus halotolerans]